MGKGWTNVREKPKKNREEAEETSRPGRTDNQERTTYPRRNQRDQLVLLLKIQATKSCAGVSLKTQELYAIVFLTRYLDLFTNYVSLYVLEWKTTTRRGGTRNQRRPEARAKKLGLTGKLTPTTPETPFAYETGTTPS